MALPSFTADQSLYRSSRHYRSSSPARIIGGVRPSDYLPSGSYLQSCANCTYTPGFFGFDDLSCSCLDESGNAQQTDLQFTIYCQGDIYNNNGVLGCYYTSTG
jgi:hypothetical protein